MSTPAPRWFVVTQFRRLHKTMAAMEWKPHAVAHAKELGTEWTACGVRCGTWHKWWDQPFPVAHLPACEKCEEAVGIRPPLSRLGDPHCLDVGPEGLRDGATKGVDACSR